MLSSPSGLITLLGALVLSLAMAPAPASAEIQAYFKACRGNWQFQSKFQYPDMVQVFTAKSNEFTVIDCAIRCYNHFNKTAGDYIFLGPADMALNPATASLTGCHCISRNDPKWLFDLENIPGMNDRDCEKMKCADGQRCGDVDKFGVHFASYLIDNPSPDKPVQQLSPAAAVEQASYSGSCGGKPIKYLT
ncbi:hypothetical protein HDU96_010962 [Phlyctochytrium bullatum]|nr:hypothetical protein HDU96_010962 [Phlyctochytrium bullatum]